MFGATLASAAVASVLVLRVVQAKEQHGPRYGQGPAMGQQAPGPGAYGQAPCGFSMGAHAGRGTMQQHELRGRPYILRP